MKRAKIVLIVVLILLIALLIGFGFMMLSKWESKNKAPFSAENANPEGIKALYKLYQVRGYETKLWKQDYQELPNTNQDLLLIVNPEVKAPDRQKLQMLKNWVAKGNTIVLWAPIESEWTKAFEFKGMACMNSLQKRVTPVISDAWLQQIKRFNWSGGTCVLPQMDQENILVDHTYASLMVKRSVGKGTIYFIPEVMMITNNQIDQLDHLYLPIAIAEWTKGVIWFDESVHPWPPPAQPQENTTPNELNEQEEEAAKPPSIFDLFNFDSWVILLQILLLILLFLYAKGKRFAAARVKWKKERRNSMEYIEAIANWYHRSGLRKEVLVEFQRMLTTDLQRTFRLSKDDTIDKLKLYIKQYLGTAYLQRYEQSVRLAARSEDKKKIPFSVFKQAIVEIQQLRKELHEWKSTMSNRNKRSV